MPHRKTHRQTTLSQMARCPLSMLCMWILYDPMRGRHVFIPSWFDRSANGIVVERTGYKRNNSYWTPIERTCKCLELCRNVLGTICFDFIRIALRKDALRTLCDRVRSVFGRDERVRNGQSLPDRTSNCNSIALRPRTSLVRSQYGSYVRNTTISFSVRWHY